MVRSKEDVFIWSCYLYDIEADPVLSDADFDRLCGELLAEYDSLPDEFKSRVPRDQLSCCTSVGLRYSDSEIEDARRWRVLHASG